MNTFYTHLHIVPEKQRMLIVELLLDKLERTVHLINCRYLQLKTKFVFVRPSGSPH